MKTTDRITQILSRAGVPPRQIKPAIAAVCGVSYQAVNQWFSGDVANIRIEHLVQIARHLNVSLDWLVTGEAVNAVKLEPIELVGPEYDLIHEYRPGDRGEHTIEPNRLQLNFGLVIKKAWLEELKVPASEVLSLVAESSSMEPTILDGDALLLHMTDKTPVSGQIYAIEDPADEERVVIRRLVKVFAGGWLMRSDSADKRRFPDEGVSDDQIGENVLIIGRVIWRGGAPV